MTGLVRRRGHYYIRLRTPNDLLHVFKTREIKKSLHTTNLKHAKTLAINQLYQLEKLFTLARCGMLTDEQINQIVTNFLANSLQNFEESRAKSIDETQDSILIEKLVKAYEIMRAHDIEGLKFGNTEGIQGWLDGTLETQGVLIDKQSLDYKKLCREMLKARIQFWTIEIERLRGNYNNDYDRLFMQRMLEDVARKRFNSPSPESLRVEKTSPLLSKLMKQFIQESETSWQAKGLKTYQHIFRLVIDIIGDKHVEEITREEFLRYRDTLMKLPPDVYRQKTFKQELSSSNKQKAMDEIVRKRDNSKTQARTFSIKTVNNHLIALNALLNWAVKNDYLSKNRAVDLKLDTDQQPHEERDFYTREDIQKLIDSPIYTTDIPIDRPEKFWIPLLGLFTGARLNELCSLYVADVVTLEGVPCIDINYNKPDKHLKKKSSARVIPLHPTLIEAGFLEYVKSKQAETRGGAGRSDKRLWPELNYNQSNKYAGSFGQWFSRYNRQFITKDRKKSFHSFRHTLTHNLMIHHVPEELRMAIDGHSNAQQSQMQRRYKHRYPIKQMYEEAILKLDYGVSFEGIKFSRS